MTQRIIIDAARLAADDDWKAARQRLKAVPGIGSGPMGLTPDAVKQSAEYREAKAQYDRAFAVLRILNGRAKP